MRGRDVAAGTFQRAAFAMSLSAFVVTSGEVLKELRRIADALEKR